MSVTLRLARHGRTKSPFYRIVAADKQNRRDGRFLEIVGLYNPMVNPPFVKFHEEKLKSWISLGAQTSDVVKDLLKKSFPGFLEAKEKGRLDKIKAARKKRKERAKARAK